jgi:hypothetical protein
LGGERGDSHLPSELDDMSGSTTTPDRWTDLLARRDGRRAASLAQYGKPGRFDADGATLL